MENHILIIDSNTTELRKLRELLSSVGYNIMTASNIETAKQLCERIPIRLVLGEANMLGFHKGTEPGS